MNVLTRPSSATTTKRTAPSFSLAALTPPMHTSGGVTRVHRGVWVAVGLMAVTIIALATALVVKSGSPATPAATAAAMTTPDQLAAVPPATTTAQPTSTGATTSPARGGDPRVATANSTTSPTTAQPTVSAPVCSTCGTVDSYNAVTVQGQTNGVGAVAGGVGGAVIGSKVAGRGHHTLGGVIGAIGGGLLGNAVEKHVRTYTMYDVHVRMDDGSMRTVRQSAVPAVGAHVTVDGHTIHAAPVPTPVSTSAQMPATTAPGTAN